MLAFYDDVFVVGLLLQRRPLRLRQLLVVVGEQRRLRENDEHMGDDGGDVDEMHAKA